MTVWPAVDPACSRSLASPEIATIIDARSRDLGGLTVARVLPAPARRMVGSFIFFDHMGPVDLPAGRGIDVRPHPHIALATVTYLFDGEIVHRDSLGSHQTIRPGEVNWMTPAVASSTPSAPVPSCGVQARACTACSCGSRCRRRPRRRTPSSTTMPRTRFHRLTSPARASASSPAAPTARRRP